jgi:hypothetical protein
MRVRRLGKPQWPVRRRTGVGDTDSRSRRNRFRARGSPLADPQLPFVEPGAIQIATDTQRLAQLAGATGKVSGRYLPGETAILHHSPRTANRLSGSDQYGTPIADFSGDHVQHVVEAVDQINVGNASSLEEYGSALGRIASPGVAGAIAFTEIGLGLDDTHNQTLPTYRPYNEVPEKLAGNVRRRPAEEVSRQGAKRLAPIRHHQRFSLPG